MSVKVDLGTIESFNFAFVVFNLCLVELYLCNKHMAALTLQEIIIIINKIYNNIKNLTFHKSA